MNGASARRGDLIGPLDIQRSAGTMPPHVIPEESRNTILV
jgi:hypothetical protein